MVRAERARTAETPKQPSPHLKLRAPYFYPTPSETIASTGDAQTRRRRAELDAQTLGPREEDSG